jgi:hypothetical protein
MHLDAHQRERAMPRVASLLSSGGTMSLTLRHGPVPPGRRMFEVSGDETTRLAQAEGLRLVLTPAPGRIVETPRRELDARCIHASVGWAKSH